MTDHPRRVTRALLSVSDKTGLIEFAKALASHGVELVSTGGTAKAIAAAGLQVKDVSELTGFPEMMDGRVKTLHPKVHGGLLAIRDNKEHADAMKAHGIAPIDLLVVNLYPFEETVDKGAGFEDCIENIDIGGPAMIRAAAKNHDDVAVVVEAHDYQAVLDELAANKGATTLALRRRLAAKAYARTAAYDAAISNWFALQLKNDAPDFRAFGGRLIQSLRYGENPHQTAAFYRTPDKRPGVATARQLQGKELSYNNINDTDAAYECIGEFDPARTAACVIVKHANPCGVAEGPDLVSAYRKAFACDTQSPYGGIIAVRRGKVGNLEMRDLGLIMRALGQSLAVLLVGGSSVLRQFGIRHRFVANFFERYEHVGQRLEVRDARRVDPLDQQRPQPIQDIDRLCDRLGSGISRGDRRGKLRADLFDGRRGGAVGRRQPAERHFDIAHTKLAVCARVDHECAAQIGDQPLWILQRCKRVHAHRGIAIVFDAGVRFIPVLLGQSMYQRERRTDTGYAFGVHQRARQVNCDAEILAVLEERFGELLHLGPLGLLSGRAVFAEFLRRDARGGSFDILEGRVVFQILSARRSFRRWSEQLG